MKANSQATEFRNNRRASTLAHLDCRIKSSTSHHTLATHRKDGKLSYHDQLDTAEWQKRRKRILKRDDFMCQGCGCDGLDDHSPTLHVHHRIYIDGYAPWEYHDNFLVTLCNECHTETHARNEVDVYHETRLFKATGLVGDLDPTDLRPCTRCLGAGIFRQWMHIQEGVCFRCRGDRYEKNPNAPPA